MLKGVLTRIERRLAVVDMTPRAASLAARLSADAIRNIKRAVNDGAGRKGVSTATIDALAPVLRTTASWLMEGEGPEEFAPSPSGLILVPEVSWVSAGKFADVSAALPSNDVPLLAFSDLGAGDYFVLGVRGDSMDRISPEGSKIVVNRADKLLVSGKYYVFALDGETTYKRWQGGDPPYLEPFSNSDRHKPIFIKRKRDMEIVGRVKRTMLDV